MTAQAPKKKRRIAVVTGTRAEYGLLKSTMSAIVRHPKLELQLVATGMHLLRRFGHTVADIERDGWTIGARVSMQKGSDASQDQAAGLARGVAGIAAFLDQAESDIVIVLGDRIEAMAGALAAVTTGRILAHIHGGDVAVGDFDESLRHAITKLAHLHFPAMASAARRIIRMGESADRVHCVGAPGIDDLAAMVQSYGTRRSRSGQTIVLYHACGRPADREQRVMRMILSEVSRAGLTPTIIHPNSDRGHTGVIRAIEEQMRLRSAPKSEVFKSLDRDTFLRRLLEADVLVGNSSSGIIEAATAGTAVVNIGDRQKGRERAARTIFDADETATSIRSAIGRALRSRPIRGKRTVYGDGRAGSRIASILATIRISDRLRRKQCTY
jgi:GDP/UDP-N,N'-diacetylbacillosamine 2-epimerase (hydrolysing)